MKVLQKRHPYTRLPGMIKNSHSYTSRHPHLISSFQPQSPKHSATPRGIIFASAKRHMTSPATILPLRTLTPDRAALLRRFYAPQSVGLFLALFLPLTVGMSLGGAFFSLASGLITGSILSALWLALRYLRYRSRVQKAVYVYEYGGEEELRFGGIRSNYGYKVNGAPQQVLTVLHNGKPVDIKTFNPNIITVYSLPQQVAYTHPRYPGIIVPSGLFSLVWTKRTPGARLGQALLWLIPFGFAGGLMYVINHEMDSHSETYLQPDARVYHQGGRLVLASVLTGFKPYEVSNKGVYGTDYFYAEALDLSTGKPLWKTQLAGSGAARLLGQSPSYLFFLRSGLWVIDKATGKVVQGNKDFPALAAKMSTESISSYTEDASYTWSDSLNSIVVKGTDGLYYTIDGATLRTGTIDLPTGDTFFTNPYQWGNNYEDQINQVWDNGSQCYALLDAQDTVLLAHNSYGVQDRPRDQSVRRRLYRCSSLSLSDNWAPLGDSVYLFGGLLTDATQTYRQPDDTISHYASYASLAARYNGTHPPLRTAAGSLLVLHKTTIEPSATLVLSAVSPQGKTLWQVRTGLGSVPFLYHDTEANKLYLFGDGTGTVSDQLTEGLCIDLGTGKVDKIEVE